MAVSPVKTDSIDWLECDSCGYPFREGELSTYSTTMVAEGSEDVANFVICPHCEEFLIYTPYVFCAKEVNGNIKDFDELRSTYEEN